MNVRSDLHEMLIELKKTKSYFSIADVKSALEKGAGESVPDSTVKTYLSKFMADGTVHDAGKGWYSKIAEPLKLDAKPLEPITKLLAEDFPLLEVSCWSTEQINPFMHHLLSRFTVFVYTLPDALDVVGDALRDAGHNVLVNPTASEIERLYQKTENPVLVRPAVTKEPSAVAGMAPPEKLLVDLLFENNKLSIMEPSEAEDAVRRAVEAGRVNISSLLSYAKRRRITVVV
ncbi:DUF6577 family protein [Pontiella sulfatireligans]|uniref:Uncharacterized protein n=1 Tax=Pontiella sulfatireligans TaxID=2750658 RepID=A0A6C2UMU8_9BACT|nr:DUF6577 family protein [Pontiella sulfatireligans]VGO21468.1 hypothetical protein SCARR_03542 [Pontiella sulfatireligans]